MRLCYFSLDIHEEMFDEKKKYAKHTDQWSNYKWLNLFYIDSSSTTQFDCDFFPKEVVSLRKVQIISLYSFQSLKRHSRYDGSRWSLLERDEYTTARSRARQTPLSGPDRYLLCVLHGYRRSVSVLHLASFLPHQRSCHCKYKIMHVLQPCQITFRNIAKRIMIYLIFMSKVNRDRVKTVTVWALFRKEWLNDREKINLFYRR